MLGLFVLAALAPLLVPATPAPPTLPEIGRVRSNTLCATLAQNIRPAIYGLIKNDELIGAGHRAFAKMSRDAVGTSTGPIDIDKLYLGQVETRLVHNLRVIDKMLGDAARFPASPRSVDERDAIAMKDQLQAVADQQRHALDLVSGTLETEALGQMQHDISGQMQSATAPESTAPQAAATAGPTTFIGTAGLPEYTPVSGLPTTSSKLSSLAGHGPYDAVAAALEGTQTAIAHREQTANATVLRAVDDCRANGPTPAPSPTP